MSEGSPSGWRGKVTAVLLMATVAPLAVAISAQVTVALIGPLVPYALVLLMLIGVYRVVTRGWWWR
jgi:hypothetical protein